MFNVHFRGSFVDMPHRNVMEMANMMPARMSFMSLQPGSTGTQPICFANADYSMSPNFGDVGVGLLIVTPKDFFQTYR